MEMTYTGKLVMPSSYALMTEEEMTYADGGGVYQWIVAGLIDAVLYLIPVIAQANAACKWGKALNSAIKAVGATKQTLINGAVKLIAKAGFSVSKSLVTSVVGAVWAFTGASIGAIIAWGIARFDGGKNKEICFG